MKNLDKSTLTFNLGGLKLATKRKNPRPRKKNTPEQALRYKAHTLINKILRGDLDISKQNDKRLFYWGLKHSVVDRNRNILEETLWK